MSFFALCERLHVCNMYERVRGCGVCEHECVSVCVCVRTFESAHMSGQEDDAQRGGYILLAILHDDGVVKLEGRKRRQGS